MLVNEVYVCAPPKRIVDGPPNAVWLIAIRLDGRKYKAHISFHDGRIRVGAIFQSSGVRLKFSGGTYHDVHGVLKSMLAEATEAQVAAVALEAAISDWDRMHPV